MIDPISILLPTVKPFAAIAPAIVGGGLALLSALLSLFKKNPTQTTTQTSTPSGYQSPTLGLMDPLMASLLTQNQMQYNGAGMPGGIGMDNTMSKQLLSFLSAEYPGLLTAAGGNNHVRTATGVRKAGSGPGYGSNG